MVFRLKDLQLKEDFNKWKNSLNNFDFLSKIFAFPNNLLKSKIDTNFLMSPNKIFTFPTAKSMSLIPKAWIEMNLLVARKHTFAQFCHQTGIWHYRGFSPNVIFGSVKIHISQNLHYPNWAKIAKKSHQWYKIAQGIR